MIRLQSIGTCEELDERPCFLRHIGRTCNHKWEVACISIAFCCLIGSNKLWERRNADFFEIIVGPQRTAILPGGLPFHRRVSTRMLDVLLAVRGETRRRFRLGIGIDLPSAAQGALALTCPPVSTIVSAAPTPEQRSGWLFHLDSPAVVATHWEPIVDEGRVRGFRVRLLETSGRAGHVRLRAFRPVASAQQVDFRGHTLVELPLEKDAIRVDLNGHEWAEVEALWHLG